MNSETLAKSIRAALGGFNDQTLPVVECVKNLAQAARAGGEVKAVGVLDEDGEGLYARIGADDLEHTGAKIGDPVYLHPPTPVAKPEPIDDESPMRRIGELGNMLHNFSCEYQNNDYICSRLAALAGEAWDISKSVSPVAPAAKVPDVAGLVEALEALLEMQDEDCRYDHEGYCQSHNLDHVDDGCRVARAKTALAAYRKGGEA